jgi:peptide/nickel transport system substrate-binding protein
MKPTLPISRRRFHRRVLGGLRPPLAAPAVTSAVAATPTAATPPQHTRGSVVTLLKGLSGNFADIHIKTRA